MPVPDVERLDRLKTELLAPSRAKMVSHALGFYAWIKEVTKKGSKITIEDKDGKLSSIVIIDYDGRTFPTKKR